MTSISSLAPPVRILGLSGILPQALCLVLAAFGPGQLAAAQAGLVYAALILSFLGGLWWMAALQAGRRGAAVYAVAVLPSLIGWAALLMQAAGLVPVGAALTVLGLCLLASPLVDLALAQTVALPSGWLRLRMMMAGGLGLLTLALALA